MRSRITISIGICAAAMAVAGSGHSGARSITGAATAAWGMEPGLAARGLVAGRPAGAVRRDTVRVGELDRTYDVYVPDRVERPVQTILAFHGGSGGSGARIRGFIGARLERLANERGFLVVYPDGIGGSWNDCRAGAPYEASRREVDEPAFVRAVVHRLVDHHGADPRRVYALGYSNGGHLAFRIALEAPETVAGIVAIAANLPAAEALDCRESRQPVRALLVNGTADRINPYEGGQARLPDGTVLGRVRSAWESAEYFAGLNGDSGVFRTEPVIPLDEATGLSVERTRWGSPGRARVELVTVHGGGHTIPGPTRGLPPFLGSIEGRYDAVAEAVAFLLGPLDEIAGNLSIPGGGTVGSHRPTGWH